MQKFTGKQYLKIDIASNFGLDKEDWDVRLEWFETHKDHLLGMLDQADNPALFYAGVLAWEEVEQHKAIGYPISLDATASGLQILACITGDRSAAELCNVVNIGHRADAYTKMYQAMLEKVGEQGKVTRDMVKQAVMTAFYASESIPKKVFGQGPMLARFYETVAEKAPAAWDLNQTYKAMWDPTIDTYRWVLPDNFHAVIKIMNTVVTDVMFLGRHYDVVTKVHAPTEEGRSLSANTTHSIDGMIVREMSRRCNYDPKRVAAVRDAIENCESHDTGCDDDDSEMVRTLWVHYINSGYLSARILDHIHVDNAGICDYEVILELLDSLPNKPFEVISIHDCFRCLPNYGNDLRMQYTRQLYLLARSNILQFLLSQLTGSEVRVEKLDDSLADDILNSNYALS